MRSHRSLRPPALPGVVAWVALLAMAGSATSSAQDPSAGATTPPAGGAAPAVPTVEAPVVPADTAVAPLEPGSTTTVPVQPGATTVVPVAPGTDSVIIQDPSAGDPGESGGRTRVPIPPADPEGPREGVVIPIPGRDPEAPAGSITVVPEAGRPGGPGDVESPVIEPVVEGPSIARPAIGGEAVKPRIRTDFFTAARDSISGRTDYATWEPLSFRTLLTEGWDEAWIGPPNGARGGPRQGWIGATDANFYRLHFLSFDYTRGLSDQGDGYAGGYTLYTPLSRRLLLISQVPFVNSNFSAITVGREQLPVGGGGGDGTGTGTGGGAAGGPGLRRGTGFGDLSFTPRVMLQETQNFSWTAGMTVQIPTGSPSAGGGGRAILTPTTSVWYNFAERWVVRGGVAAAVGTNSRAGGTTLISRLAVGRTFTTHDVPIFGDFTVYVASNTFNELDTGRTQTTVGPGFRTHLGNSFYFLGATTIPLTGPKPYDQGATFWIMKVF